MNSTTGAADSWDCIRSLTSIELTSCTARALLARRPSLIKFAQQRPLLVG
jgi:hypothetical protein